MKFKRLVLILLAVLTTLMVWVVQDRGIAQEAFSPDNRTELSGGTAATVQKATKTAFAQPIKNLDRQRRRVFVFGDHLFNTQWVQAPSSVATLDGLGPLFNRNSCAGCHLRDGRGRPPLPHEDRMLSKLIRLSIPGQTAEGGPRPHPLYGGQLQEQGILGVPSEGRTQITWQEEPGTFADGKPFSLRQPSYTFTDLAYGSLGDDVLFSPRVAPAVFGLGLLETVPKAEILNQADPEDRDGDGISGRPNYVWDIATQEKQLGILGWKANQPNLKQQIAGAFNGDMGLTTSLFPHSSCEEGQADCLKETQFGEQPEVSDEFLDKITTYMRLLAVPARRNLEGGPERRGEKLFYQAQCASCHTPKLLTSNTSEHPEFKNQVIHPYTDLLLHDMGAELSDNRPDFDAAGQEWRTPPLWGIGLVRNVNKHTFFLHDGRARNLMEAVLWHGGEAQASKEAILQFSEAERADLIAFLQSL